MSTQQWWYEQGGQTKGPLESDEIRSMVETGVLVRSSRIIVVGGSTWGTVDEHARVLGLSDEPAPEVGAATSAPPGPGGEAANAAPAPPAPMGYSAPAYSPASTVPAGSAPICSNGKRLGAYLLDALIFVVSAITLFLGWFIWAFIIFGKGQTPGKQLLGIRVVDAETRRVTTYGTMALRTLVYEMLLGSVTSGVWTIVGGAFILSEDQTRQALWDRMAKTVVVDDPQGTAL